MFIIKDMQAIYSYMFSKWSAKTAIFSMNKSSFTRLFKYIVVICSFVSVVGLNIITINGRDYSVSIMTRFIVFAMSSLLLYFVSPKILSIFSRSLKKPLTTNDARAVATTFWAGMILYFGFFFIGVSLETRGNVYVAMLLYLVNTLWILYIAALSIKALCIVMDINTLASIVISINWSIIVSFIMSIGIFFLFGLMIGIHVYP
ncbi:MAG: hypothetical protein KAH32_00925 [Chlamydiia bacterium]|nr:hypothetical protein [Chlamydiia bacterium]